MNLLVLRLQENNRSIYPTAKNVDERLYNLMRQGLAPNGKNRNRSTNANIGHLNVKRKVEKERKYLKRSADSIKAKTLLFRELKAIGQQVAFVD